MSNNEDIKVEKDVNEIDMNLFEIVEVQLEFPGQLQHDNL